MRSKPRLQPTRPLLRLVSEPASSLRLASQEQPIAALVVERNPGSEKTLEFSREQLGAWLHHAATQRLCLLVIAAADALEIYSTDRDRIAAFRPVLEGLKARVAHQPAAGKTPTKEISGRAAAERLLRRAAGLVGSDPEAVRTAASLASAFGTLGSSLGTLCWAATAVTERAREEAGAPAPAGMRASIDELAAERIVEEEHARWRSELAELRRSLPPSPPVSGQEPAGRFAADEPGSLIRIKVPVGLLSSSR